METQAVKHLVLDTALVLDMWLQRGQHEIINQLVDSCESLDVKMWFSSASLATLDHLLVKALLDQGVEEERARETSGKLFSLFFKNVSLLSCFAFEQQAALARASNLENAQIALAAKSIQGEKKLVTCNREFDTLGCIEAVDPAQALEWIQEERSDRPPAFIDLKAQQDVLRTRLEKNIHNVLGHGRYILGPEVRELETRLCEFTGAKHCTGVASGTDALLMVLMAWKIGPGDAVFTTPFTFIATAEVISLLGATPVFVDIDPQTFNLDPEQLNLAVEAVQKNDPAIHPLPATTSLTPKAVITVDLFGLPADYDPIMAIAAENNLKVLADSAQGFGSVYKGKKSGTLGHATTTSFFPAKPLGCYGDGGAVFTDDDDLAEKMKSIRVHGKGHDKYDNVRLGLNSRLHTMQAAVLLAKLDIFQEELAAKGQLADSYSEHLKAAFPALSPPHVPEGLQSAWAQYSILAESNELREKCLAALKESTIPAMVYYPRPLHMQTAYASLAYRPDDFPVSLDTSKRIFSLPMHGYAEKTFAEQTGKILLQAVNNQCN